LFSQLLDRKLNEIRENPTAVDAAISTESDIEDDYISIMRADERQRATSSNDIRNVCFLTTHYIQGEPKKPYFSVFW
jgi:hypothetical protein